MPSALSGAVAFGLLLAELAIAVGLIITASAAWAAVGASVLRLGFCTAVAPRPSRSSGA